MPNKYDIPDELIETLAEDYKLIFNQDPNPDRLAALAHYFGIEKVTQVLEYLFIKGVNGPQAGQRDNPMGYLFVTCRGWDKKRFNY